MSFTATQITNRLRRAAALATRNLPGELDHVVTLVDEARDRLTALALTRDVAAAQPACLLSAVTPLGAAPVAEFLLIPFGDVRVERPVAGSSFVFTASHAQAAVRWFEALGRKLAIDYEHQSFDRLNLRPDGLRPAAGWIGGLAVRDDGLWATNVEWTERATDLLRAGEYRYFSPVIYWSDEDYSELVALGPVALTNDPAMVGVQPLAAARDHELGEADAPEPETTVVGDDTNVVAAQRLARAEQEVALLRRKLQLHAADAFVERGLRLGKIVDSTSVDWRDDYLRDADDAEARLSRAPVLLPPGRVLSVDTAGAATPLARATDEDDPWAVHEADLAAYSRALQAGRVMVGGALGSD